MPHSIDLGSVHGGRSQKEGTVTDGHNVFTVQELAAYLRMKPLTIYKHASSGRIPGFKVGSHWRFKRQTIDIWINQQETTNNNNPETFINA